MENYPFPDGFVVEDTSGWEYTTPGSTINKTIFFQNPDNPDSPSLEVSFTVTFDNNASAVITDTSCLDKKNWKSNLAIMPKFAPPEKIDIGRFENRCIQELLLNLETAERDADLINPLGLPTVCGYNIPPWQRGLVWTLDQNIALIESIWRGIPIGSYSVNHWEVKDQSLTNIVIDGQQRLNAIQCYFEDEFDVFGAKWSQVGQIDQRRFKSCHFPKFEVKSIDLNYLKNYYNLMNFAGTALH